MALSPDPAAEEAPFWRGEVLEAMFWLSREDGTFGAEAGRLASMLEGPRPLIEAALVHLEAGGSIESTAGRYELTEKGARKARRLFFESSHDAARFDEWFTRCGPGCWCRQGSPADRASPPAARTGRSTETGQEEHR